MNTQWEIKDRRELPAGALEFLSRRGMRPYQNLVEATRKIFGAYRFEDAKTLAQRVGPYALEDKLVTKLQKSGLQLLQQDIIPFASPVDFLHEDWLSRAEQRNYSVLEIKEFFEREGLHASTLYLASESLPVVRSLKRVDNLKVSLWHHLEAIDALECHRNPALYFSVRRHS